MYWMSSLCVAIHCSEDAQKSDVLNYNPSLDIYHSSTDPSNKGRTFGTEQAVLE